MRLLGLLVILALVAFPGLAGAQDASEETLPTTIEGYRSGDDILSAAAAMGLQGGQKEVEMTLDQAINLALERNLALVVERYRRSQTLLRIDESLGIYDINVEAFLRTDEESSPPRSTLEAASVLNNETLVWNFGASRLIPTGGTAEIDLNSSRAATSDVRRQPNPAFSVDLDFTFTQPLLRNFGRDVTERDLVVSRTNAAISREDFQQQVETIVQNTSDGYWNLVENREQLAVAEESLRLAEELHEMNRIQVEVGTLAPLELVQSESGVAARQEEIIRLTAEVEDAADFLRQQIQLTSGAFWNVDLVPVTDPEVNHQPIDFQEAIETALAKRPDLRTRMAQNEILDLDAKVAKNQKLPQLDVTARFGYNALRGEEGEVIQLPDGSFDVIPIASASYTDALEQILDRDFDGWRIDVVFAYPLQNRQAKARSLIAELAVEQGDAELDQLELQILTEVRSSARGLETAAQRIESAKVASRLARKNLEAEQKRYENGMVTSFQVLQIQEDLSEALSREVSAIIAYRRAEAAYYLSIGELLDQYDIVLSDDVEP